MKTTRLILVGGFLGAGKTTLLWEAAHKIINNNQRVGLITNDQAPELVDTAILTHLDVKVSEVSGSCFCCNFPGLLNAMQQVGESANADVIIAEPVGSCTDLSATIVNPLKEKMSGELLVSPLSVLADSLQLTSILNGETAGLHPSASYIYQKQLEESDIILISKSDQLSPASLSKLIEKTKLRFPDSEVFAISVKTGEGIEEWLKEVMSRTDAGKRIVEIDYDVYAEGEAILGWLNCTIDLIGEQTDWDSYSKNLMKDFSQQFDSLGASVGHVKMMLEAGDKYLIGNLTGKGETLNFRKSAGTGTSARLTLNARVEMSPEALEQIVLQTLEANTTKNLMIKIVALRSLSPGRPNPTYRFKYVVPVF